MRHKSQGHARLILTVARLTGAAGVPGGGVGGLTAKLNGRSSMLHLPRSRWLATTMRFGATKDSLSGQYDTEDPLRYEPALGGLHTRDPHLGSRQLGRQHHRGASGASRTCKEIHRWQCLAGSAYPVPPVATFHTTIPDPADVRTARARLRTRTERLSPPRVSAHASRSAAPTSTRASRRRTSDRPGMRRFCPSVPAAQGTPRK